MLTATCCRCATRRRKRKPKWRAPPLLPSAPWEVDGMRDLKAAAHPPRLRMKRDSNMNPFMTEDGVHHDDYRLLVGSHHRRIERLRRGVRPPVRGARPFSGSGR